MADDADKNLLLSRCHTQLQIGSAEVRLGLLGGLTPLPDAAWAWNWGVDSDSEMVDELEAESDTSRPGLPSSRSFVLSYPELRLFDFAPPPFFPPESMHHSFSSSQVSHSAPAKATRSRVGDQHTQPKSSQALDVRSEWLGILRNAVASPQSASTSSVPSTVSSSSSPFSSVSHTTYPQPQQLATKESNARRSLLDLGSAYSFDEWCLELRIGLLCDISAQEAANLLELLPLLELADALLFERFPRLLERHQRTYISPNATTDHVSAEAKRLSTEHKPSTTSRHSLPQPRLDCASLWRLLQAAVRLGTVSNLDPLKLPEVAAQIAPPGMGELAREARVRLDAIYKACNQR
eukprot:gb/GEZN01011737.1/.p1 GENE.gb/GEZN01011737.1/~~gb/GEZN01011737.1/.p1  ORF type:complete len:350 (-),score=34.47 gb/GEZN01011737.1/:53-1102(-)